MSKVVIFVYVLVAGLVFSLPFLIAIGGIIFYSLSFPAGEATGALVSSKESISTTLVSAAFFENFGKAALAIVLFLFVLVSFSIFATYGYYLLSHVYRGYFEGTETTLRSNAFFDWKRVWKFAGVLGWSSLYVLAPILVGALFFLVAILLFATNPEEISKNLILGISTLVIVVAALISSAYLAFRTGFATFALLSNENPGPAKSFVTESMAISRGKILRIALLFLPFAIAVGFFESLVEKTDLSLSASRMYETAVLLQSGNERASNDVEFLKRHVDPALGSDDLSDLAKLFSRHEPQSEGVAQALFNDVVPYLDRGQLDPNWKTYQTTFNLVSFIFLEGLLTLAIFSIYVHIGGRLRRSKEEVGVAT